MTEDRCQAGGRAHPLPLQAVPTVFRARGPGAQCCHQTKRSFKSGLPWPAPSMPPWLLGQTAGPGSASCGSDGSLSRRGFWPRKGKQSHRAPNYRANEHGRRAVTWYQAAALSQGACDTSQAGKGHGAGRSRLGRRQQSHSGTVGMGNVRRAPSHSGHERGRGQT